MTSSPPSLVWGAPFLGLLLSIALAPLVAPRVWHRHYGKLTAFWSLALLVPDAVLRGAAPTGAALLDTALLEYLPFALLLGSLFVIAGGLRLTGTPRGAPGVNTAMLAIGTLLASVIGTPGAAMLMIRPLIRANRHRRHSAHVFVFVILLVANVGGALTPLGNPPLFLGFLSGVPFFWPLTHLWAPTLLAAAGLLVSFYALDSYTFRRGRRAKPPVPAEIEKLGIDGVVNLPLLALVMGAVLLRTFWHPDLSLPLAGLRWNAAAIAADALFAAAALASLALTTPQTRRRNDFAWEPMIEVAVLFAGIFITLIPVTAMIAAGAHGPAAPLFQRLMPGGVARDALFYWVTGLLSAILDNAPSYLVLLQVAGKDGAAVAAAAPHTLAAISIGAVFFGALTYIGNAPNLLIRGIAESHGIRMPRFFAYIGWASLCLLPWLLLVQLVFFA
jgi:Na+/H+ antiporter NhaD/arsenite permease-like protein